MAENPTRATPLERWMAPHLPETLQLRTINKQLEAIERNLRFILGRKVFLSSSRWKKKAVAQMRSLFNLTITNCTKRDGWI